MTIKQSEIGSEVITMKIKLKYEKETKNKYVYKDTSDDPVIESLYIKKDAIDKLSVKQSDCIVVTIDKAVN